MKRSKTMVRLGDTKRFGDFRELDDFMHRTTLKWATDRAQVIEEHFKILLKPAPWWCPERVWLRMAGQFITLGEIRQ